MNELRLFIDSGWPHRHSEAVWYLCGEDGRVLGHGRSEPRHWPGVRARSPAGEAAADSRPPPLPVDLILTGGQVSCHRVRLPRGGAGRRPEILLAALEDLLLADPSDCLLLPGDTEEDGLTSIAVLGKERLRSLLSILAELGLQVRSVWADGHLLPQEEGKRDGRLAGQSLVLPLGHGAFATVDLLPGAVPGPGLKDAVPPGMKLLVAADADPALAEEMLGVPLRLEREAAARFPLAEPPAGGFLVGEFAPPVDRLGFLRPFLPALRLAGGMLALSAILVLGEWGWLSAQAGRARESSARIFHDLFPQAAVVDPVLQMQRQLDDRRLRVGRLADGDLLAMLEPLAGGGQSWQRLEYSGGRLEGEFTIPATSLEGLAAGLLAAGYRVELQEKEKGSDGRVAVRMLMERGER